MDKPMSPYAAIEAKRGSAMRPPWRTGKRVAINVYEGDRPVCQCQTAADAALVVAAVNYILDQAREVIKKKGKG